MAAGHPSCAKKQSDMHMLTGNDLETSNGTLSARSETVVAAPDICRLEPLHISAIRRFLIGLDPETRWHRFGEPMSDAALELYSTRTLRNACLVLGVFCNQQLRGVLELYRRDIAGRIALWLVVERDSRRLGMGWRLLDASIQHGPLIDARSYDLSFSRDNWPMRRLAHKAKARLDLALDTYRARIDLRPPKPREVCYVSNEKRI